MQPNIDVIEDMDIASFMFDYRGSGRQDPTGRTWYIEAETGKELKFEDCRTKTDNLAKALKAEYGIGKNDILAIYSPNACVELCLAYLLSQMISFSVSTTVLPYGEHSETGALGLKSS